MNEKTEAAALRVEPVATGWLYMWLHADGQRRPMYSHGPTKPYFGPELNQAAAATPLYTHPAPEGQALAALRELVEALNTQWRLMASGHISGKCVELRGWHEDDIRPALDRARASLKLGDAVQAAEGGVKS